MTYTECAVASIAEATYEATDPNYRRLGILAFASKTINKERYR